MALERVVVLNDLSQAKGGATGLALMSARRLSAAGLDVTYICGDEGHSAEAGSAQVMAAGSAQLLQRGALHAMRRGIYNPDTRDMVRRIIAETDTPGTVYHRMAGRRSVAFGSTHWPRCGTVFRTRA